MVNILSNRATLYSVFFLSVVYLFFLLLNYDFPSVFFFGLVGLVSSFFTRNMVVVLSISLIVTMILKMGGVLGVSSMPPIAPASETTITTEMIFFEEDDNPEFIEFKKTYQSREISDSDSDSGSEDNEYDVQYGEIVFDTDIQDRPMQNNQSLSPSDLEIVDFVKNEEPSTNDLLMVPGYQSSIMLSHDSTLDFDNPIEMIPVDMESTYGYEFNNPFSKLGQKCGVSDQYSCFN
jgi:hypothetical protein